jgi:rhodanese-related sulfurtransferase
MKLKLMAGLVGVLLIGGWLVASNRSVDVPEAVGSGEVKGDQVTGVSPAEFDELMTDQSVWVVDVHTPEQTHIPGTDAVVAYDDIAGNLSKFPGDKNTPVAVYCRSGSMSAQAAEGLAGMGYKNVYDLMGGTDAYKESGRQSVSLEPKRIDLGTVIYGDVARAEFTLTNYTGQPLAVTKVSTSCGCTKAEVVKKSLGAFESTKVEVSFDPAVHKDDTDLGDITRTIYVETNNPSFAKLTTEITATVVKK